MATVVCNDQEIEVFDGDCLEEIADELGVPLGCSDGRCRSCEIIIESGAENLEPKSEREEEHDLEPGHRLACQCKIKQGQVKFRPI